MLFREYVKLPEECSTTLHSPRGGTVVFTSPRAVFKVEGKQVSRLAQFERKNCRDVCSCDLVIKDELVIPPEIVGEYILYGEQNTFEDSTVHCIDCSGNKAWSFSQKDRKLARIVGCPDGGCYLVSWDVTPQPENVKKRQCKFEIVKLDQQGRCEGKFPIGKVHRTVMSTQQNDLVVIAKVKEGYYDDPVIRDSYHPEMYGLLQLKKDGEERKLKEFSEVECGCIEPVAASQQDGMYLFRITAVGKKNWVEIYHTNTDGIMKLQERRSPISPVEDTDNVWYLDYGTQSFLCECARHGPYQPYVLKVSNDDQLKRTFLPVPRSYQCTFKEIIGLPNGMVISIWQESLTQERSWQGRLVIHYNGKMKALTTKKKIGHIAVFDDILYVSEGSAKSWWLTWCPIKELEKSFAE